MKAVILVVLFIVTASFLTKPERNAEYLQQGMDVYLSSKANLEESKDVAKLPVIKILKSSSEGDFEITLKGLSHRLELPRQLRKYLKRKRVFKVSAPHCRFTDAGLRVVSCPRLEENKPLAEAPYYRSQKIKLIGISSGVFVGDIANQSGKMETQEIYMIKIALKVPSSKKIFEFQFVTSPGNIIFSNHKDHLLASRDIKLKN